MQEVMKLTETPAVNPTAKPDPAYEMLSHVASANAVVVLTASGCCMCHVVKQLLIGLGVGPAVVELDPSDASMAGILAVLRQISGYGDHRTLTVLAVFVGGKLLGGVETVMACHISGTLVPLLKDAGALWL